ncbi:hypothetical protein [Nostoc sp. JL31]|nr:hypothetical protein [Nostoc sp. JL31]
MGSGFPTHTPPKPSISLPASKLHHWSKTPHNQQLLPPPPATHRVTEGY